MTGVRSRSSTVISNCWTSTCRALQPLQPWLGECLVGGVSNSQQAAFVLIDDKANQDVMTIMEFASIEYEQALQEYLNYNMNLEQWSTNYFQWRVC